MAAQPKWRKILYEHQGVPDHYVDETFLDELKKNCKLNLSFVIKRQKVIKKKRKKQRKCLGGTVPDPDCRRPSVSGSGNVSGCGNAEFRDISYGWLGVRQYTSMPCFMSVIVYIREYEYWKVVKESGVVIHQLCSVCIFVVIFIYMDNHVLSPEALVVTSAALTLIGYSINWVMMKKSGVERTRTLLDDVKTLLIFAGFSYSLSPVLVSLTETIATDTIYAMTTVMLLANLFSHDYGADAEMVSGVLSLNTGLFASVCMASRLHTAWHSFALVTFAIQVFALWPALRRNLRQGIPASHTVLTVVLSIVTVVSFMSVSLPAAIMFMIVNVFITFVCPAWLVTLQPFKNNIYGPWDEAVIED